MKKNYSLYVHAVHSRLQLIRNKINVVPQMSSSDIVDLNEKYFISAGKSVEKYHNHVCNRLDFIEAAELFKAAYLTDDDAIKYQPEWKVQSSTLYIIEGLGSGDTWHPVDPDKLPYPRTEETKLMSYEDAQRQLQQLYKIKRGRRYFRASPYRKP